MNGGLFCEGRGCCEGILSDFTPVFADLFETLHCFHFPNSEKFLWSDLRVNFSADLNLTPGSCLTCRTQGTELACVPMVHRSLTPFCWIQLSFDRLLAELRECKEESHKPSVLQPTWSNDLTKTFANNWGETIHTVLIFIRAQQITWKWKFSEDEGKLHSQIKFNVVLCFSFSRQLSWLVSVPYNAFEQVNFFVPCNKTCCSWGTLFRAKASADKARCALPEQSVARDGAALRSTNIATFTWPTSDILQSGSRDHSQDLKPYLRQVLMSEQQTFLTRARIHAQTVEIIGLFRNRPVGIWSFQSVDSFSTESSEWRDRGLCIDLYQTACLYISPFSHTPHSERRPLCIYTLKTNFAESQKVTERVVQQQEKELSRARCKLNERASSVTIYNLRSNSIPSHDQRSRLDSAQLVWAAGLSLERQDHKAIPLFKNILVVLLSLQRISSCRVVSTGRQYTFHFTMLLCKRSYDMNTKWACKSKGKRDWIRGPELKQNTFFDSNNHSEKLWLQLAKFLSIWNSERKVNLALKVQRHSWRVFEIKEDALAETPSHRRLDKQHGHWAHRFVVSLLSKWSWEPFPQVYVWILFLDPRDSSSSIIHDHSGSAVPDNTICSKTLNSAPNHWPYKVCAWLWFVSNQPLQAHFSSTRAEGISDELYKKFGHYLKPFGLLYCFKNQSKFWLWPPLNTSLQIFIFSFSFWTTDWLVGHSWCSNPVIFRGAFFTHHSHKQAKGGAMQPPADSPVKYEDLSNTLWLNYMCEAITNCVELLPEWIFDWRSDCVRKQRLHRATWVQKPCQFRGLDNKSVSFFVANDQTTTVWKCDLFSSWKQPGILSSFTDSPSIFRWLDWVSFCCCLWLFCSWMTCGSAGLSLRQQPLQVYLFFIR